MLERWNVGTLTITYVLLSPTFGMHQYTADLANRGERWNVRTRERANDVDTHAPRAGYY